MPEFEKKPKTTKKMMTEGCLLLVGGLIAGSIALYFVIRWYTAWSESGGPGK
jgi:hypothetical protein